MKKKVVITGASSGIGEAMAYEVARRGGTPILLARNEDKLNEIKEKIGTSCYVYSLDVTKEEDVKQVFALILEEVGGIDVLINNAGFGFFKTFEETPLQEVKDMFDVNVFGLVACTQAVLPSMRSSGQGHIINIASQAGKIATPKSSAYAASKHAVLGFTNSLRMELDGSGIVVTAINPGPIKTNFLNIADSTGSYAKSVDKYILDADMVAKKVIDTIGTTKREISLPSWMGIGPKVYGLFPGLFEKLGKKKLSQK